MKPFKSITTFFFVLFVAGLAFLGMSLNIAHILFQWNPVVKMTNYCLDIMNHSSDWHLSIGTGLLFLIGITLFLLIWNIGKHFLRFAKLKKQMNILQITEVTKEINKMYDQQDIIVIHNRKPLAFTAGFLTPQIVLSTGLLDMLEQQEVKAVILHEEYHRSHYDPLKMFLVSLLSSALWFIPVLKRWMYDYRMMRELLADEAVIQTMGSQLELSSALLKLIKNGLAKQPVTSVSFADQTVNMRIRKLLDPNADISMAPKRKAMLVSSFILLLLLMVALGGCA